LAIPRETFAVRQSRCLRPSSSNPIIGTVVVLLVSVSWASAAEQEVPCGSAEECRARTEAAIRANDYEGAHDLAWLAFQKGAKSDPLTLMLLARAQSLSGRSDDAYVMLRRLAEAGVSVSGVRDSEDFRRVRSHPGWNQLVELFDQLDAKTPPPATATDDAPAIEATTAAREEPPAAERASVARAPAAVAKKAASPPSSPAAPPPESAKTLRAEVAPETGAVTTVGTDLNLPSGTATPVAIAYDSVSARFVFANDASDALTVLSQTSTNAAAFTSRGWSGGAETQAVAIDRQAGDLWVALNGANGSALHRLQLISGRRLEQIDVPGDTPAEWAALAITRDGVLALDRAGRRIFRRAPRAKALNIFTTLPDDVVPIGLTSSRSGIYVAHAKGMLRIDFVNRRTQTLKAADPELLAAWHSLAWHDGVLLGIKESEAGLTVMRAQLNASGNSVTRVETLGSAASPAATMSDGVYYYLPADQPDGTSTVRAIKAR
jgi:hypothetical protein